MVIFITDGDWMWSQVTVRTRWWSVIVVVVLGGVMS